MKTKNIFLALVLLSITLFGNISCKKSSSPGANEVFIEREAYNPTAITVTKGTTVTWTNKDNEQHSVTSDAAGPLNSPTLNNGSTYQFTTTTAGTFTYHCNFHSTMHGTLIVTN